jgi:hypothetical protein
VRRGISDEHEDVGHFAWGVGRGRWDARRIHVVGVVNKLDEMCEKLIKFICEDGKS